jgi:hypothetical protein
VQMGRVPTWVACAGTLLLVGSAGCGGLVLYPPSDHDGCVPGPSPPRVSIDELESSPLTVLVDSRQYVIGWAWLVRDFQPMGAPPDGWPMMATVVIAAVDSLPFPPDLDAPYLWVIKGDSLWATGFSDNTSTPHHDNEIAKRACGGPKWEPGGYADVVVGLVTASAETLRLMVHDQLIQQLW